MADGGGRTTLTYTSQLQWVINFPKHRGRSPPLMLTISFTEHLIYVQLMVMMSPPDTYYSGWMTGWPACSLGHIRSPLPAAAAEDVVTRVREEEERP